MSAHALYSSAHAKSIVALSMDEQVLERGQMVPMQLLAPI